MTLLFVILALVSTVLIIGLSYIQLLYGEGQRIRRREAPGLAFFEEYIQPRLKMDLDFGRMVYSLSKQMFLVLMALSIYAALMEGPAARGPIMLESFALSLVLLLLFSFFIPKILLQRSRGTWLRWVLPLLITVAFLTKPLAHVLQFVQTLFGLSNGKDEESEETTTEDIDALITAGAEEGIFEEEDRKLIQSVVEFRDKTVREVMTPRPNMVTIDADKSLDELRQLVIHEQFSRIPVQEKDIDHIIGFVHVRDMFEMETEDRQNRLVRELVRPIKLVPETKSVKELLSEMQADGTHMVIVISEYGQTAGLATMEDLVEEILGEIRDEHEPARDVTEEGEGVYVVAGSYDVDHLGDLVGFKDENGRQSTTVGGLVTEWLGHVPKVGEAVEKSGIRLEVLASDEFRVERVRVSRAAPVEEES